MSNLTISHEIEIAALPAAVWAALADTASYPHWNPFVRRLDGELQEGARLDVEVAPPGRRSMRFKPTVLAAEPDRELRWLGRFLVPGLVDGEHVFRLEVVAPGRTRLVQSERFSGLLVGLLKGTLASTQRGFAEMNEALKLRVEAAS